MKIFNWILFIIIFASCSIPTKKETTSHDKQNNILNIPKQGIDTLTYFSYQDKNLNQYLLPKTFNKPENWKDKSKEAEFYGATFSDTLELEKVLSIIDDSIHFEDILIAKSWSIYNYKQIFPHLVSRLSNKKKVGLTNTADLIIWCRIETGDLKFYGHGGGISEDIFTIAGRASWILNEITGEKFASVQCNLTVEESKHFKNKWIEYISELR